MNAAYDGAALQGRPRFGLNVTAANARVDSGDGAGSRVLQVAPQAFGNAPASFELPAPWPVISAALRFTDRRLTSRAYDGGFSPSPSAPPLLATRLTLTGAVPSIAGRSYRIGGEHSFAKVEPYVIGAAQFANDNVTRAELAPIRRLQAFIGLGYAFDPVETPWRQGGSGRAPGVFRLGAFPVPAAFTLDKPARSAPSFDNELQFHELPAGRDAARRYFVTCPLADDLRLNCPVR